MSNRPKAAEIAARLWPPPDPVNHCKRETVRHLAALELAIQTVTAVFARARKTSFQDLGALWIKETRTEEQLALARTELQAALREMDGALAFMAAGRMENELRFYDERLLEREEKRAER